MGIVTDAAAENNSSLAPLIFLGHDETTRLEAYRALFKAHLDEEIVGQIRNATNGNFALGSDRFQREIETALGRRARRGQAGRPVNQSSDDENQLDLL